MACIETVSFDADQTLFDFERTMREALVAVSSFLRRDYGLEISSETLRSTRDHIFDTHKSRAIDMLDIRKMSFAQLLDNHQSRDIIVDRAMEIFEKVRFGKVYLYPNVLEVLERLTEKYNLALITNGNSDPERVGLDGIFDHILLGEKYAFKKPDRRIFHELFRIAKIDNPASVCHVGDSLEDDVGGANRVGAVSVWFNPLCSPNMTDIIPNHAIHSMLELPEILTR